MRDGEQLSGLVGQLTSERDAWRALAEARGELLGAYPLRAGLNALREAGDPALEKTTQALLKLRRLGAIQ